MRNRQDHALNEEMMPECIVPSITKQPECILEAMELISDYAECSKLSDRFFQEVEIPSRYLSERLQITPLQAVMLSLLMENSDKDRIRLSHLAEHTGCNTTRILRFSKSLDGLAQKFYIRVRTGSSSESYRIPYEVRKCLRDNIPYKHTVAEINSVKDFFDHFEKLMKERKSGEICHPMLCKINEENMDQIADSHFVKALRMEVPEAEDRLIFVFMVSEYISMPYEPVALCQIVSLYDYDGMPGTVKRALQENIHCLQTRLIENSNDDGLADFECFSLTEYAKNEVLKELSIKGKTSAVHDLTKYDSLPEKTLIFNENEDWQIRQLSTLLMPDLFCEIQKNLEKNGLRRGFCCLLYGEPGTGKTETVYQIARSTGRDILQINVDEVRSKWVGDSEKNIKNVFDRYRSLCDSCDKAPILLFNEADAILGIRTEGVTGGVDKMENSVQNIILQEMELLNGIMIATTNLTRNLDKAFERRFLYKIRYEKPTEETRSKLWMQMLRGLTEKDARILASRFDFSGGEIENIVRKHSVSSILSGTDVVDIQAIIKTCEQERIMTSTHCRVGFC